MLQIILFCNDWHMRQINCVNEPVGKQFPTLGPSEIYLIHGRSISNHCDEEIQSNNVTAKDVRNVCKHTDIVFKHFIQNI